MDLTEVSEVNMGLVFTKRLSPLALRPETLIAPYDKMLKEVQTSEHLDMSGLAIKYGPSLINAALDAAKSLNGLGSLADWPKIQEETAAMYQAGTQMEKWARKLQEGQPIDWAKVSQVSREAQIGLAADLITLDNITPGKMPFVPTGWKALDEHLGGLPEIGLVVVGGRPGVGKTWFMANLVTRYARKNTNKTTAVFSLEMTCEEVAERFKGESILEAQIPTEEEQKRMYFCDKILSGEEIVQKCTTIDNLGLVCIDFADLTIRGEANEGTMSILYKTLAAGAKEMGCTIVLFSQLSRRNGIPKPSDLRWCLPESERVFDAQYGNWRSIKGFDSTVLSLTSSGLCPKQGRGFENEVQDILQIRSASGFVLRCSSNHPFLTESGWKKAKELTKEEMVAVARTARPTQTVKYSPARAKMLGYMIGDGYMPERSRGGISWSEMDDQLILDFQDCFDAEFPDCEMKITQHRNDQGKVMSFVRKEGKCGVPNAFGLWLEELGARGMNSFTLRIPAPVFTWDDQSVANLIAGMFASDGTVSFHGLKYFSKSHELLRDLKLLLLRFSVVSRISKDELTIKSLVDLQNFCVAIHLPGKKGQKLDFLIQQRLKMAVCHDTSDVLPFAYTALARQYKPKLTRNRRLTRARFEHIRELYDIHIPLDLQAGVSEDIWWDRVVSIEPQAAEMTYDMTVPDTENFVAEGFITHNTGLAEALGWMILMLYDPASDWTVEEDNEDSLPVQDGCAYIICWKVRGGFRKHADDSPGAILVPFKGKFGWHPTNSKWFTLKKFER